MTIWDYGLMVVVGLAVAAIAFLTVYIMNMRLLQTQLKRKNDEAQEQLAVARKQADDVIKKSLQEAREIALTESKEFDRLQKEKNLEIKKTEERLKKKEETLDKRGIQLDGKEQEIRYKEETLNKEGLRISERFKEADLVLQKSKQELENVAKLSVDQARELLTKSIEVEAKKAAAHELRQLEADAKKTFDDKARAILAVAVQRMTNEFVTDATVSVVSLPSDDMKGRIIGREGRNIKAIEQATGVDVIIDDTPEAIIISCFNPVRREIAKTAIERLVQDGRIHPARIDEVVQKTRQEFDEFIYEAGEQAAFECGVTGLHRELIFALGKLKYMFSGGQSVLQHCIETSKIAGVLAAELEMNIRLAKRAALLHDIGKSLDDDIEGHHTQVGSVFLQKSGEAVEVVEAAAKHHVENLQDVSPITVIVQTANMLSHFRPGARKDFVEKAVARLRDMEAFVEEFDGVEQAFVVKAGREVRAMVTPSVQDDAALTVLARTIIKELRLALNSPNGLKLTLIREQKVTHIAK